MDSIYKLIDERILELLAEQKRDLTTCENIEARMEELILLKSKIANKPLA